MSFTDDKDSDNYATDKKGWEIIEEFIPKDKKNVSITTNYGRDVIAAVSSDNIFGSQFHPEKSQNTGIKILANFLNL